MNLRKEERGVQGMTVNELNYNANLERERSNREAERELRRSHQAQEAENVRSHKVSETEAERHNRYSEQTDRIKAYLGKDGIVGNVTKAASGVAKAINWLGIPFGV